MVSGAGGIGRSLAEELQRQHGSVTVVSRSGAGPAGKGVRKVGVDVSDPAQVAQVCTGATVVYHCVNPPYHRWLELFPAIQASIIEGVAAAGARLVMADNLYMYGRTKGKPMTEETPAQPVSTKGELRALMSQQVLDAHHAGKLEATIGRASDYFGPHGLSSHMGGRVFYPLLANKRAQVIGNPDTRHTYHYLPDIAQGLITLGERQEAVGRVWHLPSAGAVTTRQFVEMIAEQAGSTPGLRVMPPLLLASLSWVNPTLRAVKGELYQFEDEWVSDDSAYRSTFKSGPTPLPEAISATVDWYRTNPRR